MREKFSALVRTEEQLLFVIHVTGPFLQRLHAERYMRPLLDLAVQYYRMLAKARTHRHFFQHSVLSAFFKPMK